MLVDRDRVVPADVIDELCELATWAPNHKKTWPWRFASFTGDARVSPDVLQQVDPGAP